MPDESSHSYGPAVPPEALSGGTMNHNPLFRPAIEGEEPAVDKTQFGYTENGRNKYIKPGRYEMKPRKVKGPDGKLITVKGMIRTDH